LSSRGDPFPCVVHEALASRTPVICFENSGGAPEMINSDIGFVVGYCDIYHVCKVISELIDDDKKLQYMIESCMKYSKSNLDFKLYSNSIKKLAERI